jgi:hypothetical protein
LLIAAGTDYQGFAGRQTKDPLAATLKDLESGRQKILQGRCARRTSRIIRNIFSAFRFNLIRSTTPIAAKSRRRNGSNGLNEKVGRSQAGGVVF